MINIDFETRSKTNLLTEGLYNYASCPSTEVIVMCYAVDGGEVQTWHPGDPVPDCFQLLHNCWAWNADFERLIFDYVMGPDHGFPVIPLEHWRCSMYQSACNNMPAGLGNAARCLRVDAQKDKRGMELIKLLCIPHDGEFYSTPELLAEMDDYCAQDVRAEMACSAQMRLPTEAEWADYHANCRINDRGVRVDIPLCEAAQIYAGDEEAELVARIQEVTRGVVQKAKGKTLTDWVMARLTPDQEKLCVKYRNGERKLSLDKYNRGRLLSLDDLDPDVSEVVQCSDFASKSSVSKFRAMALLADPEDDRVRGSLVPNGASASGRYSSRGCQVHNFPRDGMRDPMEVHADLMDHIMPEDITDYFEMPIMTILSRMLRPALVPAPGKVFLGSDWSAIEGRVAPWLCDNPMGAAKVAQYASNAPVYELAAAGVFHVAVADVTKDQRQIGKVCELAFGYQGGANAFLAMARNYGLKATKAEADVYKEAWRKANPWAPGIWSDIERAATLAVKNPGRQYKVGRLAYFAVADVLCGGITLFCELPCGRLLTYPDVRIEMQETPWGEMRPGLTVLRAAFVPKANEKEWPRTSIYGGLLFENAVQGTAASLLRGAVLRCEASGLKTVFHVHDELVLEERKENVPDATAHLHDIMNTAPGWAAGLPLKADVEVMKRFGK